jgi:glucokinase
MSYHLGLDIGATNTRCRVVDDEHHTVEHYEQVTPQQTTAEGLAESIGNAVDTTLSASGRNPSDIATVGIASFGPLDTEAGTIIETPNLESDLSGVPVLETVAQRFPDGVPTTLLNDAVAGVVTEYELGGDDANVVYLTLSSGIGAGVVVDRSLLKGHGGNAAEVGHFTLQPDSCRRCGCGAVGHWEALASGENIPDYAREIALQEDISTTLPLANQDLSPDLIFDKYGDDHLATEVVNRVGKWNAIGIANIVHAFAPDRIAVGGALALHNPTLVMEPVIRSLENYLMVDSPMIHLTRFGEDVVILGAIRYAMAHQD